MSMATCAWVFLQCQFAFEHGDVVEGISWKHKVHTLGTSLQHHDIAPSSRTFL